MVDALDHRIAQTIVRQMVAGAGVDASELELAVAHVRTCPTCGRLFEVGRTTACDDVEDELMAAVLTVREGGDLTSRHPAVAGHVRSCLRCRTVLTELAGQPEELPRVTESVDATALFERALIDAMRKPEAVARSRAAERMGTLERPGTASIGELARAASEDRDPTVRAAALRALDELDTQVSIPERLIQVWAATPLDAAPFIAGVLNRLAGGLISTITRLAAGPRAGPSDIAVTGDEGIRGSIVERHPDIWLRLRGLPARLERTRPIVAAPMALAEDAPDVRWFGDSPGLVLSQTPVTDGSLDVLLARGAPPESEPLFQQMYLLSPEPRPRQP